MSAKHTLGPWVRVDVSTGSAVVKEQLCTDDGWAALRIEHDGSEEGRANAELVASAPDLLAVLREQTRLIEQFLSGALVVFPSAIRGQAADAIAKAEGRAA